MHAEIGLANNCAGKPVWQSIALVLPHLCVAHEALVLLASVWQTIALVLLASVWQTIVLVLLAGVWPTIALLLLACVWPTIALMLLACE